MGNDRNGCAESPRQAEKATSEGERKVRMAAQDVVGSQFKDMARVGIAGRKNPFQGCQNPFWFAGGARTVDDACEVSSVTVCADCPCTNSSKLSVPGIRSP